MSRLYDETPLVNETFSWEIVSLFLISIFMQESPVYQQRPELEELYLPSCQCTLCCSYSGAACSEWQLQLYHLCSKSIQHVCIKYNCTINRVISYSKQLYPCFYKLLNLYVCCFQFLSVAQCLFTISYQHWKYFYQGIAERKISSQLPGWGYAIYLQRHLDTSTSSQGLHCCSCV